ncbi:unnamed protein product, partial [Rotaria socialis]
MLIFAQNVAYCIKVTTAVIDKVDDEGEEMKEYTNKKCNDDEVTDDTSDETDSMDDGSIGPIKVDLLVNDDELFDESPVNDQMKDEEVTAGENKGVGV